MKRSGARWFLEELPGLVRDGLLEEAAAQKLRLRYASEAEGVPARNIALVIFGSLGSLLIGGGIILILAHNWDQLGRGTRAGISVALLLAAQAIAGAAVVLRPGRAAWNESAGAFLSVAVGASIALVSQTYHIPGDYRMFLLVWAGLIFPLSILMESRVSAAVFWLLAAHREVSFEWPMAAPDAWFWALAAAGGAYFWCVVRTGERDWRTVLLAVVMAGSLFAGALAQALRLRMDLLWAITLSGLFAFLFAAAEPVVPIQAGWRSAWKRLGLIGILVLFLILTFEEPWESVSWAAAAPFGRAAGLTLIVSAGLGLLALARAVEQARARRWHSALPAAVLIPAAIAYLTAMGGSTVQPRIIINIYMFAIGVACVAAGLREGRLTTANTGLLFLASLAIARFFDSDVSFLVRGIGFVIVGVGFLSVNLFLARRRRSSA